MGKRPAEVELFVGNMGSIQREIRASMQREDTPTMETGLERIAAKARCDRVSRVMRRGSRDVKAEVQAERPVAGSNLSSARRLDFTVLGPAVIEAAGIEAVCASLEQNVI